MKNNSIWTMAPCSVSSVWTELTSHYWFLAIFSGYIFKNGGSYLCYITTLVFCVSAC